MTGLVIVVRLLLLVVVTVAAGTLLSAVNDATGNWWQSSLWFAGILAIGWAGGKLLRASFR